MDNHELETLLRDYGTQRVSPPAELMETVQEQISGSLANVPLFGGVMALNLIGYIIFIFVLFQAGKSFLWYLCSLEIIFLITNISLVILLLFRDKLNAMLLPAWTFSPTITEKRRTK
ncbi:MAG: hypothetical protein GXO69_00260 [Acidobacteria bacterium]|nr:hypothetical protein [Acidobacteriota bacterium]